MTYYLRMSFFCCNFAAHFIHIMRTMTFLRYFNILLIELFLIALPIGAQTVSPAETDSLTLVSDTIAADSISPNPEWYVAPEIPINLRAPKRAAAAAASCTRVEAIQTFNIDSVLTEGTYYEYDDKGNVISTTVWTYNPDGTMTGKSKNEYAFDATGTQTMTAVYIWDGAANDWKGTEKYEYVYKTFAGEKKMTSNTSLVWLNGAWVADQRYTYSYDEAGREIEYYEYIRNTISNDLQPFKGHVQSWANNLQTLDIQYTTYANGQWTAGTKKEWAFDGNGTQTMYATYTISNGNWIGDTKETWTYGRPSGQLTLHEKYGWAGNDWSITLQENTTYDASGNTTLIENYSWINGVKTGTKKEEYSFDGGKPVLTMVYAWSNGAWIGSSKEVWNYNASSKLTLHEKYGWANNDWSLTLQEKTVYSGANITLIENYTWSNGVKTGTQKEEYTYSGSLKTSFVTYSWAGSDWVGASKEIWAYTSGKQTLHETYAWGATDWSITLQENTAYSGANITLIENYTWANGTKTGTQKEIWAYTSGKQTLHETFAWGATDWSITLQENTAYSGANITKIENYTWTNGTKTGTQKEEYAYTGSQKTQEIIYAWTNDVWVESTQEVWAYTSGKQTLHETYIWNGDWSKTLEENTTYDGANITKIENYTYSDGVKTGTQKEEYTYTSGEKTMTVVYAWANNDWVYSTKNEAGYRDGNVEVSATNYAWNGSAWVGTGTRTKTTYDGTKVIEKLTQNWPSGATDWTNAAITTNTYNADGENIMTYNGTWNGSRWTVYSMTRTDIIFDEAGHQLLRASWRCGSDSVWTGIQKDTAAYTAANLLLYSAQYTSWDNNNWVASYRVEYEYDSANRVTLNQRYDWKNNKWQGKYKYEYEYDAQGRQTMSATYSSWNKSTNKWVGSSKKTTEYDNEGRIKSMTTYKWSNNKWLEQYLYSYLYDNTGREIEQIVQFYSGGKWVNMLKYENAYSGNKQTKANTYSWLNNQWVYSSRSESTYDELSPETLRRQVNGTWAAGSLLSYSDDYYYYNCDPHFYTVRFVNYDGSVLESTTAQEGETPVYSGSTPTKPADTENTYTFSGWNPDLAPVTSNVTYTATFTNNKNTYTITWKNEDGSIIKQEKLEYGTTPAHADITKESTAEYTYTFAGWTPGIGIVTSDAEYTATFTQTKRSYVITFKNEDGSLISTAEVEYGTMPTIPTAPTKPADGANTYTFAGWDKEIVTVTEAATYTATYTATKKTYTITWKNEDGSVIESETLEYGVTPVHDNIEKEATAEWTYTFAGWDPAIIDVVADATYTAKFDSTKNSYTISWLNWDNSLIDESTVDYGETPTHVDATKEATAEWTYTFKAWEPEIVSVTGEATYTAKFDSTKNSYTITWFNWDNSLIDESTVDYGETPTHVDATREATAEWTYTFKAWDPEIVSVTGNATYTAKYDSTKISYTITWLNENGTEIDHTTVEYGELPTHEDPIKEATAEFIYTFAGWTPEVVAVTGDATYTASFTEHNNKYTITFVDEDGTTLQTGEVEYGQNPEYTGQTPTKETTDKYTYEFTGWTPELGPVTRDSTYTATYTSTLRSYTITWLNWDNSQIDQTSVDYGTTPTHVDATREATAEWTYTFTTWDPEIVDVVGDATYTAQFDSTKNSYTITWLNADGSEIEHETLEYGATPEHADIVKEATTEWTYSFLGWEPEITTVTGDANYKAIIDSTKNSYTVTWLNADGSEIEHETLEYGATPEHADIDKEATAEWTYTFAGWDPAIVDVVGDAFYKATFDSVKNTYTITWLNADGSEIEHETLEYGATPAHADIIKENTDEWTYTFAGWDPAIVDVVGDAFYKATFDSVKNTYTITWLNADASEIEHETLEYGATPEHEDATKEATAEWTYTFTGWDPAIVNVIEDAAYKATFDSVKNSYTITWLSNDGSEIDHASLEYGATPSHDDATKEATAEWTYTFTGWTPEIVAVIGDETYTAQFDSTKNSYTVTWLNNDGTEIDHETLEYGSTPAHADIDKENTAEWTYTFTSWDPEIVDVVGDATYTAQFDSVKNIYTITWLNWDNSLIDETTVEYGVVPTHDDPTKAATDEYTYTFASWEPEVVAVIGDASYTATFDSVKNSYTVTWLNDDNSLIDQTDVEYGVVPTHDDAIKEATAEWTYTFTGWDPAVVAVTGEATYTAQFDSTKNTYTITWLDDQGDEIDQTTEEFGATPTHDDAVKEATAEWTYSFTGWDPTITEVTGNATYTAQFDSVKNSYTITWLNEDGTEIDHETLEYGSTPTHADIDKENTDEWTYTFVGWTPEITTVTGDASYTATFDSVKNAYTITWRNWDDALIDETTVEYGVVPTHDDPIKEATAEWTYTFAGWEPEVIAVIGEATYTAQFDSVKNTYTITWLDDQGDEIDQTTEEYGATPTHDDAVKEATAEWTYSFTGWDPAITEVTGEATYTAQFDSVKNTYTITWLNWDNSLIDETTVEYGVVPTHDDPTKAETEMYSYTFAGWEPEVVAVTGNATYTATFDSIETTIYYHISITVDDAAHGKAGFVYADEDSSTLLTDNEVAEGTWIELRAKAAEDWHFDHWSDGDTASVRQVEVTADMQFTAYFALNCGDYPTLPVVSLYDWLLMLDVRSIHAMGYTFAEEDVIWYRVNGAPDKESDGAKADDERVGTGYSFTLNESLVNSGDYYATVDVSSSPAGTLCSGMMRSQIVHFASTRAAMPPMLTPALVRPNEPQHILRLDPDAPTTITIYDLSGHLLHTFSEEGVDRMDLQAESVAGSYQVVVQNGDLRTVLRYIVVQ